MKGNNFRAGAIFFTISLLYGCLSSGQPELGPTIVQGNLADNGYWGGTTPQTVWVIAFEGGAHSDTTKDIVYIQKSSNESWTPPPHFWYQNSDGEGVEIFGSGLTGFEY